MIEKYCTQGLNYSTKYFEIVRQDFVLNQAFTGPAHTKKLRILRIFAFADFNIIQQDEKLTKEQMSMVCDHLRTMMYTTHGTRNEDHTADLDEAELHKDETFYTLPVATIKGTRYEIVGRIDRYHNKDDGTKTLVEIKNRTRGLFNKVRLYEMVQVQTYLQMTGMPDARLVEQFNDVRKSYCIEKDQASRDNNILPKLIEFCKALHHNMSA